MHAAVERSGLRGDVAGRVSQAQERFQSGANDLGHDLAVPVAVEPVDHHAIEAGQVLDDRSCLVEERF